MDDLTMARLLAKHALPNQTKVLKDCVRIFRVDDGGAPYGENWEPANVTDHAIEAAEAAVSEDVIKGWSIRHDDRMDFDARVYGPAWETVSESGKPATALSLALIRALGVEEEPTDAAD